MSWRYGGFEKRSVIRTDKGIKARAGRGRTDQPWWSARWIEALEALMDPRRLQRGRSYARKGQVLGIAETPTGAKAPVQGSRRTPYTVEITLTHLSDAQWAAVLDKLGAEARFAAQLLAGEMPQDVEAVFEAAGADLFPGPRGDLKASCTCPDWAEVCKHIAATHYVLAERLDADPFLLFRLRGRSQDKVLAGLRARHAGAAVDDAGAGEVEPRAGAYPGAVEAEPPLSLAKQLDSFWRMSKPLDPFPTHVARPTVPHPVLQRLGPAPFTDLNVLARLRPVYDEVTRQVMEMEGDE